MQKIIENKKLELKYKKGFGAWTYHLIIPGTAHVEGKWGDLKVSGLIDDYELKEMNLAPRKNEDKMISINKEIRNAIGKSGGDVVTVTLYLHTQNSITEKSEIVAILEDAGVLKSFQALNAIKQKEIIWDILTTKTEARQIEKINRYVHQFFH